MTDPVQQPGLSLVPVAGGLARVAVGGALLRVHSPANHPAWFGPAVGSLGTHRFDVVGPRVPAQRGVCYLGSTMLSVVHEAVLRGLAVTYLSRSALSTRSSVSRAVTTRDLLLIDLCFNVPASGLELQAVVEPPDPFHTPPYPTTQPWATIQEERTRHGRWPAPAEVRVDGIVYGSRFGGLNVCVALWEHDAVPLRWDPPVPLGDHSALDDTLDTLGVYLGP